MAAMAVLAVASSVGAETGIGAATLELEVAPGLKDCPREAELAQRIDTELRGLQREERLSPAAVHVSIWRNPSGYSALVEVSEQPQGQRQIESPRCDGLGDALAVAIAVILDGQSTQPEIVTAPDQPIKKTPRTAEQPARSAEKIIEIRDAVIPAAAAPRTPPLRRGGWGLWLGAGFGSGAEIGKNAALTLGAELDWLPFTARLGAFGQFLPTIELAPGKVTRSRSGAIGAGCVTWGRGWRLLGCGHIWLGVESFQGQSYAAGKSDRVFWGAAGPGIGIETGQRMRLGLDAFGLVNFFQDRYVAPSTLGSWQSSPVTLWVLLRIGLGSAFGPYLEKNVQEGS